MGCEKLQTINDQLKKDLLSSEIISSTTKTASSKKKLNQLKSMKGSMVEQEEKNRHFPAGQRLYTLVNELEQMVDAQRTRLDLSEEEATHFRQSYHNISKEYHRVKNQFETLA